jgi:hypothetical protein
MLKRVFLVGLGIGLLTCAAASAATTETQYLAKVMTAAPPKIVKNSTIVRMEGGSMQTLQKGTNGFTCMVMGNGTPMCADPGGMAWLHALVTHGPPTDKTGFIYMLAGDTGTSNTNPYATKPEPGNHWVQTGPHVMIVGPAAKTMASYPKTADANPTEPYLMWPGSPYEHLMLPVK